MIKNTVLKNKPFMFEIYADDLGEPYLKKIDRRRNSTVDGRGSWVSIGKVTDVGIEKIIKINQEVGGLICLMDEDGFFRALVLTE